MNLLKLVNHHLASKSRSPKIRKTNQQAEPATHKGPQCIARAPPMMTLSELDQGCGYSPGYQRSNCYGIIQVKGFAP